LKMTMWISLGITVTLLALANGATIKRGPIGAPEGPLNFDCSNRVNGFYTDYQRDCKQFYLCKDGEISVFHCTSQTRFDEGVRACVSEETFACIEPSESYVVRKLGSNFDCSSRSDGYYAAKDDDCKTFHHCSRGISTSHQCSEGTKFDESINACVLAELAKCGNEQIARGSSDKCASKRNGYYPSEDDCSKFYRCSKGILTTHQCDKGTKFDAEVTACVVEELAKCGTKTQRGEEESYFDCSKAEDGFYAHVKEDCRAFEFCHRGHGETFYCADGTKYDENQRACMPEKDVKCQSRHKRVPSHGPPSWLIFDCTNRKDGFYADKHRDCRQFYRCQDGNKSTYFCSPGTQFSEGLLTCVHEGPSVCQAPDSNIRQIKFRRLQNLLEELRDMIHKKKH